MYALADIAAITASQLVGSDKPVEQLVYDTRRILNPANTLFIALQGAHRDGHDYVAEAYALGVRAFWVSSSIKLPKNASYILSNDVLAALHALTTHHRAQCSQTTFVGLTGSNGKTTVKEWAAKLIGREDCFRSPGSWNSQLGVALSILRVPDTAQMALIEAGISQSGEMNTLANLIQPQVGLLTHIGDAHEGGFASRDEKLKEKLKLFYAAKSLWVPFALKGQVQALLPNTSVYTFGTESDADLSAIVAVPHEKGWSITLSGRFLPKAIAVELPVSGNAALQSYLAATALALSLEVAPVLLAERTKVLQPISMRTELITDHPQITLINDSYTADMDSVQNALLILQQDRSQPNKHLILSDIYDGKEPDAFAKQQQIVAQTRRAFPQGLTLVGPLNTAIVARQGWDIPTFPNTESLMEELDANQYLHTSVLLKGGRRFQLERLIPILTHRPTQNELRIDLSVIRENLQQIRSGLPAGTGIIGMVKAAAYGSGRWEVAQLLAQQGVEILAVAFPREGIHLRDRGNPLPIIVMNGYGASVRLLQDYKLSVAVGTIAELRRLVHEVRPDTPLSIHLEVDTGMRRMGLRENELAEAVALLRASDALVLQSVFSHLTSAEDPQQDACTRQQIADFNLLAERLRAEFPQIKTHILNSAGAMRFPDTAGDYVRLGIGLYGLSDTQKPPFAHEAISLASHIIRLAEYPEGTAISYGGGYVTQRPSRLATLPLGYADGLMRRLSQAGMHVLVQGIACPVVGAICMDMCMVDVTDVPNAHLGDEVIIFGKQGNAQLSLRTLAKQADTIPYELLSRMSPRIRRVFLHED